jgi:hypothetical protein
MQQCFGSGSTMQYYCFVTALDKIFEIFSTDMKIKTTKKRQISCSHNPGTHDVKASGTRNKMVELY